MTKYERSSQLWSLLALAAINRQVLTYEIVSRLTGMPRPSLGGFLDPIANYCIDRELPPLTALVVSEKTGLPGSGFHSAEDVPLALVKVFEFDWLKWGCPKTEKIAAADKSAGV